MNSIICFPIETKVREFDGKILIITHLLQNGKSIIIGSRSGILRESYNLENSIIVLKSLDPANKEYYRKMIEKKNKLIVYNVEGGILYNNEIIDILSNYQQDIIKFIERIIVFGSKIKNIIEERATFINKERVIIAGDPRFDLLKSKYISYYSNEVKSILVKYNKFILINTSFVLGNSIVGEKMFTEYINNSQEFTDDNRKRLVNRIAIDKQLVSLFVEAIHSLALDNPKINFILRPHPSESEYIYRKYFTKIKNVIISKNGSVHNWILAAMGIIHYDCTTGIEATIAGKPTISYIPIKDESHFAWLPSYVSSKATNLKELKNQVGEIVNGNWNYSINKTQINTLSDYIDNINNMSYSVFLKMIQKLPDEVLYSIYNSSYASTLKRIKTYFVFTKNILLRKSKTNISLKKYGKISKKEIFNKIETIKKIENFKFNFEISRIGADAFFIKKK